MFLTRWWSRLVAADHAIWAALLVFGLICLIFWALLTGNAHDYYY